ncbi:MAG: hypothetical protein DRO40_09785 [Thermoprotei archaeon]|nr:MAG: hypothetical protein DRO40_09785 [Thermoprotei archaeon]
MVFQIPFKASIKGFIQGILIKKSSTKYEVFFPELLDNGTIKTISRNLLAKEFDWSSGTFTDIGSYSIETASGYSNPISFAPTIGYDFDNDRILLVIGEWDGSSTYPRTTNAKLIAIDRDLSGHEVLIDDILSLVKNAAADADQLRSFGHAFIHSGLGALIAGAYAGDSERSVIIVSTDGGQTWNAIRANSRYDYVQERLEPIWDGDTFLGFLTEGHGTNSHWIKTDGSIEAGAPGGLFTTEPIYDMINNKVIWIEWGSGTGDVQHVWVADPSTPFTATDVTPSGTITDNEGNSINLATVNKLYGNIFTDGENYKLVFVGYRGGIPESETRLIAVDLPVSSESIYDLIVDDAGNDRFGTYPGFRPIIRAIDPSAKKLIPTPILTAIPYTG